VYYGLAFWIRREHRGIQTLSTNQPTYPPRLKYRLGANVTLDWATDRGENTELIGEAVVEASAETAAANISSSTAAVEAAGSDEVRDSGFLSGFL